MQNLHSMRCCLRAASKGPAIAAVILLILTGLAKGQGSFLEVGPITDSLNDFIKAKPSAAMDAGGNHVVAWTSVGSEPFAAFFRLTDAAGDTIGLPVQVSPYPEHFVTSSPAVAMKANGQFVIAWTKVDSSPFAVFYRRYDASGTLSGDVTQVSPSEHFVTSSPSVAMDANGNFVIAWTKVGSSPFAVFFQRYDASGTLSGDVTQVSPPKHLVTSSPSVAMDANGNFVIAWTKVGSSPLAVFSRRYDASGTLSADVTRVSPEGHSVTAPPTVAMAADGAFVVAWNEVGSTFDAFAQLYTASSKPVNSAFIVNESGVVRSDSDPDPGREPEAPVAVAMNANGNFTVVWTEVGSEFSVFARRFDADGDPSGSQFKVSLDGMFVTAPPTVAASLGNASHAVAWTGGSSFQVAHKLFVEDVTAVSSQTITIPENYALEQNYPNPFNPTTIINYDVPSAGHVELKIYNTLGQEIRTLANSIHPVGAHQVSWDGRDGNENIVASGVYFYQLKADSIVKTRKMLFIR